LDEEAKKLLTYAASSFCKWQPSQNAIDVYHLALKTSGIHAEHKIPAKILDSKLLLKAADGWTRFFEPNCLFQQKIMIASAVFETQPVSAKYFLPIHSENLIFVLFKVSFWTLSAISKLLLGLLFSAWLSQQSCLKSEH